jgi:hypothetical protein
MAALVVVLGCMALVLLDRAELFHLPAWLDFPEVLVHLAIHKV